MKKTRKKPNVSSFGLKLKYHPGQLRELDNFEKDL